MHEAKKQLNEQTLWKLFPSVNSKRGKENKNKNIKGFVYTFNKYADYFGIDTCLETNHFLSQIVHESDQFKAFNGYGIPSSNSCTGMRPRR